MNNKYVTALLTEDFLPGVLVLDQSLKNVQAAYSLLVLVTPNISKPILELLQEAKIETQQIEPISNPNKLRKLKLKNYTHIYSKLQIFNLISYDKIIFLDADTFVCNNIDALFQKPHMSAANAGGMLPELKDWANLNSGVLVLKPDQLLFEDFMQKKDLLSSIDGGDQGFLQSYYSDWTHQKELHLCHGFNMYIGHISRYRHLFGYKFSTELFSDSTKIIKVLHFWGTMKPWLFPNLNNYNQDEQYAFSLWYTAARQVLNKLPMQSMVKLNLKYPKMTEFMNKPA